MGGKCGEEQRKVRDEVRTKKKRKRKEGLGERGRKGRRK